MVRALGASHLRIRSLDVVLRNLRRDRDGGDEMVQPRMRDTDEIHADGELCDDHGIGAVLVKGRWEAAGGVVEGKSSGT